MRLNEQDSPLRDGGEASPANPAPLSFNAY